ncbi:alpha/beta hydrolase-fold protein [uncultured Acetobacteroides sp.]|uniref:alpha/beta hydrolase n=1 Tax=uncultured Acetobacteroides sp. TaxID=1760811 RepID=UPI0029F5AA39|nr:alpha/beta hydrolase-fold protein [uncultured Acetobacteroides sp.]
MKKLKFLLLLAATALLASAGNAQGIKGGSKFLIDTLQSRYMNEPRVICIYLPKDYSDSVQYPVVFATDGQIIADGHYRALLDSMIDRKIIPPVILAGAYSNDKPVPVNLSYRNYEYVETLKSADPKLKDLLVNHIGFFTKELIPYIEARYSISKERGSRFFYGVSNGAGFGITLSKLHPELFSELICFSPLGEEVKSIRWRSGVSPTLHIAYGSNEDFAFDKYLALLKKLKKEKYSYTAIVYNGGHERLKWEKEFVRELGSIFANRR